MVKVDPNCRTGDVHHNDAHSGDSAAKCDAVPAVEPRLPPSGAGTWGLPMQLSPLIAGLDAPGSSANAGDDDIAFDFEGPSNVLTRHNLRDNRADPGTVVGFMPYTDPAHEDRPVDMSKPVLVLVHGMGGNLDRMASMAARAHKAGHQVFFFKYDTATKLPQQSGAELATLLGRLQGLYAAGGYGGRPLDIISHSMGGPVTRAALNTLQAGTPRGGFSDVRLLAVDAPWSGVDLGHLESLGGDTAAALSKDGAFFEDLYATPLEGVQIHSIGTRKDGFFDVAGRFVDTLYEIDAAILRPVVDAIVAGQPIAADAPAEARNVYGYLAQDTGFAQVRAELESLLAPGDSDKLASEALQKAAERAGFFAVGDHNSILWDRSGTDDAIDRALEFLKRR